MAIDTARAKVVLRCQNADCGAPFEVWRHREAKARFCSLSCANLAKKTKERKIVEVFGEYWHRDRLLADGERHETPEECAEWYRELGWECRVVWTKEVEAFAASLTSERVS